MPSELFTPRLHLKALSVIQLDKCLNRLNKLEDELGLSISKTVIDTNVTRAINMKLARMAKADIGIHDWFTYWLIIIKAIPVGVGLIGFKGYPDIDGRSEIGYGIDADYRNQGYMTEAVLALCQWAFINPGCRSLTANSVSNPASEKVLEKAGWQKVKQGSRVSDWSIFKIE
jgi:[ribosomal protein S5]-alanine N-acetyltransferase